LNERQNKIVLPFLLARHKVLKNKKITATILPKKEFTRLKAGVLFESSRKMRDRRIAQHQ